MISTCLTTTFLRVCMVPVSKIMNSVMPDAAPMYVMMFERQRVSRCVSVLSM